METSSSSSESIDCAVPADRIRSSQPAASEGKEQAGNGQEEVVTADQLEEARAQTATLNDKYLRLAADFDNFRKRSRRDVDEAEVRSREQLLREFLPVFDNLERALSVANEATDVRSVAEGVSMVLRQFTDTLERMAIRRVPTVGTPFDPTLHEAIQQLETSEHLPGMIVAEVQGGYALGDKLVRAAMVVVAKAPAGAAPSASSSSARSV